VLDQHEVRPIPILVVNGPDRDGELLRALVADERLRVHTRDEADLPAALRAGRELVDTEWFAELDDDDALLPGALAFRLAALEAAPGCDVVITNGIRRAATGDRMQVADAAAVRRDPLRALIARHWLMPGSYLCRSSAVGPELFDGMPKYLENTYLAIRFAKGYRFCFADHPTVVRYLDTPGSESKSRDYVIGQVAALERLLELDLPPDVAAAMRRRVAESCHAVAGRCRAEGAIREAWRWHLRSLSEPRGWRYLPFTWRLLQAGLRP
jgi:glycosyltransferase involved in cell wall biosynthesis